MRHLLRLLVSIFATLVIATAAIAIKVYAGGGEGFWPTLMESLVWDVPVFSLLTWAVWEIGAWNARGKQRENS